MLALTRNPNWMASKRPCNAPRTPVSSLQITSDQLQYLPIRNLCGETADQPIVAPGIAV